MGIKMKWSLLVCYTYLMCFITSTSSQYNQDNHLSYQDDDHSYGQPRSIRDQGIYTDFDDDEDGERKPMLRRYARFISRSSAANTMLFHMLRMSPSSAYGAVRSEEFFEFLKDSYPLPDGVSSPYEEYDFVIVGGGSAGCVLASRLSEGGRWSVLLLEAGGPESILSDVPIMAAVLPFTAYNWGYMMEETPGVCQGLIGRRCRCPKGKALGGSSVINLMMYTRGAQGDWDRIAAAGNPGWSYQEVFPYYMKSERAKLKGLEETPYHNKDGLMGIEYPKYLTPLSDVFLKAAAELGNNVVDYNQGHTMGFDIVQTATLNGRRHSAAKAFLHPFRNRRNLHILTYSRVTKIVINPDTKEAEAVEYVRNRMKYRVKAKKEVIVSAGVIASPQLLMLSGVGPKQHLEELGIPLIKDLQVGQTMYDHVCYIGHVFLLNTTGLGLTAGSVQRPINFLQYLKDSSGPFTTIGVEALGFLRTNLSREEENYPDIEIMFSPSSIASEGLEEYRRGAGISDELFDEVFREASKQETFNLVPVLLHPKSKGFIRLKDKNPFHWPLIYYDYLSDRHDMDTLVAGVKYALKFAETEAFKPYGAKLLDKPLPQCKSYEFGSDEYWECAVRSLGSSFLHHIATCKMGPESDPYAVVDSELRVYGVKKLRVVDASIIPIHLAAHTNAPAMMVAEKAADMIKKTWT